MKRIYPLATFVATLLLSNATLSAQEAEEHKSLLGNKPLLSGKLTDYASVPTFGGYYIGKYTYTDQEGKHGGDAFSQRNARVYVNGTILNDFKYRIQVQFNNASPHMKDYYLEWARYKELTVRVGQYKRAFTFENPFNPFDVGRGDYATVTKKLAGMGDYNGEANAGGRDQGLQLAGDLFPAGSDGHRYLHYQLQMMNGQGINASDKNGRRDWLGTIQFQPVAGLYVGLFGWTGNYTSGDVTVDRNRWAAGVKYDHNDWTARAEYVHSQGHKISDYDAETDTFSGTGRADGWYALVGIPVTPWGKLYVAYDAYRDQANWESTRTAYSLAPNIRLHKNLLFQLQYNYVHDRLSADRDYNEVWAEMYVRF